MSDEVGRATVWYMHILSEIYDSEADHGRNTGPFIYKILGMEMSNVVNTDGTRPDRLVEVLLVGDWHESVATLIREDNRNLETVNQILLSKLGYQWLNTGPNLR